MNRKPRVLSLEEAAHARAAGITHAELRAEGLILPVAGADPATDPLLKQVQAMDSDLEGLRQDAGEKWKALEEVKAKVGAHEGTIEAGSDLFKELDEAGKSYGAVADKIAETETAKKGLIGVMAQAGVAPPADGNGDVKSAAAILAELRGEIRTGALEEAGERVVKSEAYQELKSSGALNSKAALGVKALGEGWSRDEVKALLTAGSPTSAGAFTTPQQIGYYPLPLRPLTVLDLITIGQTDSDLIEYVRMTSLTNNAREVPEAISDAPIGDGTGGTVTALQGGQKPQSAMDFERVQEGVSTIAHWVASTRRAIGDPGQLRTIIDGALRWGLDARVEAQIVAGDGIGDNLKGILEQPINSVAAGPEPHADKISHGMVAIRLDGFEPTGCILNPLDAETIRLTRTNEGGAGTGTYLYGGPNNPGPATLWGLPIAESPAIPQGTAIVGALRAAIFWMRSVAHILASDSHEDFFTRNLIAVLAELTGGFGIPTPQAFAEVNLAAA